MGTILRHIRRGVRSDAQLSSTETRFQKCSQSGKNGSKHPMLSISMAYNVISCKKSKETVKKSKSLILQCKFGSRAEKLPKIAKKTDHSIAIYSIFCIGMVYFGCLQVNPHIQAVQNMCEGKEIGINNSMYLQFTEQYRMAKGLC